MEEVKKSLKDLRSELKVKRSEGSVPISKLSRASVMAELSKYGSAVKPKDIEVSEAVELPKKKKPTNSKVKILEEEKKELEIKIPKSKVKEVINEPKTPKPKAELKAEPKAEPKAEGKKPLTAYQKLWGEGRKKGMSPKDASDYAKSKL
jgi:hypothetical protein